ncbi:uncharacterized protein LOC122510441 isoform X2 [Leptopilina heterotoma]|uniref:uncharacterized protein LOC122510441 isoform X2 n=1 Tax=Leptopilina heterotoma TaxID=63436 RepID=UPI001CA8DC4E|nr:uncharacterized protein LOC122510441 isoform X2 [Leptopilina heterotoma]
MNPNTLKHWLNRGEIEKLEHVVLEGRGARLLGERSPDLRTRVFLKGLPNYLTKISQIHEAVTRGSLLECQKLIAEEPKKKFPLAKDSTGTPLLHKAVYYDHIDIVDWLIQQFPATVQQKDREGRTALHYCAACRDIDSVWDVLIEADCDASICDKRGNPAAYYLEHQSELELPETERMSGRKIANNKENLDFKPSNIRIWIHNKDIGKLQRVLWEGHGSKLRCETSNNPRVKKFLEAVPFIMGTIKEIHARTIKNDVEGFKRKIAEPVSPIILCSKDGNGLNVLHKAAGLGHIEIVKEILELYPAAVLAADNDGKTPLHYAAAAKDEGLMYNLLVEFGADEGKVDHKFKAPAFYKNRPSDVDMSALLVVPDAPRVSGTYPKNWDWRILETDDNVIRDMRKSTSKIAEITEIDETFDAPNGGESPTKMKNGTHKTEPETKEAEEEAAPNSPAEDKQEEGSPEFQSPEQQSPLPEENAENEGEPNEIDEKGENEEIGENDENDENELEKNDEITEEEKNEDNAEEEKVENNIEDDLNNTEKDVNENITTEQEERNDASTGDSGVDDPTNEDFHVILDEQEEEDPQESDVNENGLDLDEESDDPEIEKLTQTGNMEQLAELVLNGEGRRLVGRQTSNPELQSFIDNVPAFMGKIHAVHMAAREGNLRDLQSALDRRKFAIARDESSPRGATALHVAVIFGHTTIIRYFAGRFPETANAVDLDGRTPLHYAATLADNGHYFNLLVHLGANPQIQDKLGHKAEYYKQNQEELSHKKLLRSFGAQESLADEMLNDKVPGGDKYSARRDVTEPETLATLERCFRILAGSRRGSLPNTPAKAGKLLSRCLKRPVFERLKHRVTCMDHNLLDVIWPALKTHEKLNHNDLNHFSINRPQSTLINDDDLAVNVVAPDYESYIVFQEFFDPLLREIHCLTASGELPDHPASNFYGMSDKEVVQNIEGSAKLIQNSDLDSSGKYIISGVIECTRNLAKYPLPLNLTINQLENSEREITSVLMRKELLSVLADGSSDDEPGTYYTLIEVIERPSDVRVRLAAAGLLAPITEIEDLDEKRLHGKHWPYGRGVYLAAAGNLAIWVNVQDHIRVICSTNESKPGKLGKIYVRIAKLMSVMDQRLLFKRDTKLGFLSARPNCIGNTLRIHLGVKFPTLSKDAANLKNLAIVRGLECKETIRRSIFVLNNQQCLSITELQTLQDFCQAALNVLSVEKEMTLNNNSMKIANVISSIFRKRKSSGQKVITG